MPASRRAFLKASAGGVAEGQLVRLGLVDLAAEDGDLHVHQREAERAAAFALLAEHFDRGGEIRLGQRDRPGRRRPSPAWRPCWNGSMRMRDLGREHLPADVAVALAGHLDGLLDRLAVADARLVDADVRA